MLVHWTCHRSRFRWHARGASNPLPSPVFRLGTLWEVMVFVLLLCLVLSCLVRIAFGMRFSQCEFLCAVRFDVPALVSTFGELFRLRVIQSQHSE